MLYVFPTILSFLPPLEKSAIQDSHPSYLSSLAISLIEGYQILTAFEMGLQILLNVVNGLSKRFQLFQHSF